MLDSTSNLIVCFASLLFFCTIGFKLSNCFNSKSKVFLRLPKEKQKDWESRNNSTFHAVVVSLLSIVILIVDNDVFKDIIWGKSWKSEIVLSITIGYLLSDMLYLLSASRATTDAYLATWVHHTLAALVYGSVIVYGCFAYIAIYRLVSEMSTPFVNARWLLDVSNLKGSRMYYINGWVMVATFFISRIVVMPYSYYVVFAVKDSVGMEKLALPISFYVIPALTIDALNLFWFWRMLRGIHKYFKLNNSGSGDAAKSD